MKHRFLCTLACCALLLMGSSSSLAKGASFLNFQKLAFYFSRSENKYYLVVYATDSSTKLDTDNVHIIVNTTSEKKVTIRRNDLLVVNLGERIHAADKKYTFFRFNIVLDNSGSIDDANLRIIGDVLTRFIQNLPVVFEAQVIKFSSKIEKSTFTKDKQVLIGNIQAPFERGQTALFDAIANAVEELKYAGDDIPLRFSVILTDGKDNASKQHQDRTTFKQHIVSETRNLNIPLFVVGVTNDVDGALLKDIAGFGIYQHVPKFPDIDSAFKLIGQIINNTYIIRMPALSNLKEIKELLIVKESLVQKGKYETIQDIPLK